MKACVFAVLLWAGGSQIAFAEGVGDCDQALVISTYDRFSSDHVDYRLASFVTKDTYDKISGSHNGSILIYGIPMSGSWNAFKEKLDKTMNKTDTSLTRDQALNIMWTGLDPNAVSAYSKCLDEVAFSSAGLHLGVKAATASDITIAIKYAANFYDPKTLHVKWTTNVDTIDGAPFQLCYIATFRVRELLS